VDVAAVGAGVGAFKLAQRSGGGWARAATGLRRLGTAVGVAGTLVLCGGLGAGFHGVRLLQERRVAAFNARGGARS